MKKNVHILTAVALILISGIVWAVVPGDGASLYDTNCASCHGPLTTSGKREASAGRIAAAIAADAGGMGGIVLSADQIAAIAEVLATPAIYDGSNFTVLGRLWQPAPSSHLPGKDNGPGVADHHPGEDCGICHTPGGRAANKTWTMSGTVYDSRAVRAPLAGAEVIFQNISGNVVSMTTNELGNFWTDKPFFNNPNNANAGAWYYKGWVRYGDKVRPMVSIAPVGSSSRMSCSMHHAGMGSRGGLWAVQASTLRSYPSVGLSYGRHIFPILRSKCAPCHIPGDTTARSTAGEPPYDYSHGLDLMTYAGSSVFVPSYTPHGSPGPVPDKTWTKAGILSVVDVSAPASSLLLVKTLEGASHAGGSFWTSQDADYKAILQWIREGAPEN